MPLTIRPLTLQDIPADVIQDGKKSRLIFRDGGLYFGGFLDDKLVSLIYLVIHKNGNATIGTNYTLKEYRGRGYFTELNKFTLKYARDQGVKSITLNCLEDSVGIHLKQGARVWKTTTTIYWLVYDLKG
jgi:RimJ/RimL family protein N-acetyltransferase